MPGAGRHWWPRARTPVSDWLAATFGKPFKEAVAAFRLRLGNLVPTERWDDKVNGVWQAQHDRAFMVAGATKADLLADLAAAVDKAISQGTSLQEFRRDFRRIVEERGWHGWTGEGTKGGEAWRTRVIYRTNMRVSYAAGRMAQLVEGGFPFWVYRHGGSVEPRIIHLGWDGLVLPPDHPFWATHAPPNGWGCSCYVLGARSFRGAQRLGGQPGKQLPDGWQKLDPKTGAPVGIDKGWAYAPGASAVDDIVAMVREKSKVLPQPLAEALADEIGKAIEQSGVSLNMEDKGMKQAGSAGDASPADRAFSVVVDRMMKDMYSTPSGNADADFARAMIPHHQAAVGMATVVLKYGSDPALRRLAQDVVEAQTREIETLQAWLADRRPDPAQTGP